MVRTNLVILRDPSYAPLVDRYAELGVEVVASLAERPRRAPRPSNSAATRRSIPPSRCCASSTPAATAATARTCSTSCSIPSGLCCRPTRTRWRPVPAPPGRAGRVCSDSIRSRWPTTPSAATGRTSSTRANSTRTSTCSSTASTRRRAPGSMCARRSCPWAGTGACTTATSTRPSACPHVARTAATARSSTTPPTRHCRLRARSVFPATSCYACTAGSGSSCGGTIVQG